MTVVVGVVGALYSDSRITATDQKGASTLFSSVKLYRKKNAIIGLAGDSALCDKALKWYGTKRKFPKRLPGEELEMIVVDEKGMVYYDEDGGRNPILDPFYAIGSGAAAALGALHAGATPEKAVEIACKVDPGCGLPLQILRLSECDGS